jgi:pyruvate-formate lyase
VGSLPVGAIISEVLDYDEVPARLNQQMEWLAMACVHALNLTHWRSTPRGARLGRLEDHR